MERLAILAEVAVLDPSDRAVDLLRQGLPPASTRQGPHPLERLARIAHLVAAARRGYGWPAIPHLVRIAADEAEGEDARLLALEGAALALRKDLVASEGDSVYCLRIPPPIHEQALLLFAALERGGGPLGQKAKDLVAAAASGER